MPLAFFLGLGCAVCWGVADFVGGVQSRHLPALGVVLWSQIASTGVLIGALVAVAGDPGLDAMAWGAAGGCVGGLALTLFYRGLAVGMMSIVAPISAAGAVVPVAAALVTGEIPTRMEGAGIAASLVGVVLVSRPAATEAHPHGSRRRALALALGAGLGFGLFFVVIDQAITVSSGSPLWVLAGVRVGSFVTLGSIGLVRPGSAPWPGRRAWIIAVLGIVDMTATTLFTYAVAEGNLAVVAVLSSQYPVVTVGLARGILGERLSVAQAAGAALALAGVGMLAAG